MMKLFNEKHAKKYDYKKEEIILLYLMCCIFIVFIYCIIVLCCLKYRKNTESKNPKTVKTKNGRIMLLSKYAVCGSKRSNFIKEKEASVLLNISDINTHLIQILLVDPLWIQEY